MSGWRASSASSNLEQKLQQLSYLLTQQMQISWTAWRPCPRHSLSHSPQRTVQLTSFVAKSVPSKGPAT